MFSRGDRRGNGGRGRGSERGSRGYTPRGRGGDRGGSANGRSALNQPRLPLPRNACRFFWETGYCRFELDCRFEHRQHPVLEAPQVSKSVDNGPRLPPISRLDIISKVIGSPSTDALFKLNGSPKTFNETQQDLRRFLSDSYLRFERPRDVYLFMKLVSFSNKIYGTWDHEDRQVLLNTLALPAGKGYKRLSEIVSWPVVSSVPGSDRDTLSFQQGYLPVIGFLTSQSVMESAQVHNVNALYGLVHSNFARIGDAINRSLGELMPNGAFNDPSRDAGREVMPEQIFISISTMLLEYMSRYKDAVATHSSLREVVTTLRDKFEAWRTHLACQDSTATEEERTWRSRILPFIEKSIHRPFSILDRTTIVPCTRGAALSGAQDITVPVDILHLLYIGPGNERPEGPRHDNDHVDINEINIPPTHGELTTVEPPYLPYNVPGAPHSYPSNSMQRLLDIHFRLLREELIADLREAVKLIFADLNPPANQQRTVLKDLLHKKGGYYKTVVNRGTVVFPVYTNITFSPLTLDRRGVSCVLNFDAPPFRGARSQHPNERSSYWESATKKKLMQGSLIALIWGTSRSDTKVYLGIVMSSSRDLAASAADNSEPLRLTVKISFMDPEVEIRALEEIKNGPAAAARGPGSIRVLTECPIMYESIRPFLEALRVEPSTVPFERYLAHPDSGTLKGIDVEPPLYSTHPGVELELRSLLHPDSGVDSLKLITSDPGSIEAARTLMKAAHPTNPSLRLSRLDPSQIDAVLGALTSEVSLTQGPPGTGKSYCGVQLLRVLVENKVGPILVMAFTNHAVDHLIRSVLDSKITSNIVRLGSHSADELIASKSLENLEKIAPESRLRPALNSRFAVLKDLEGQMMKLMNDVTRRWVPSQKIMDMLEYGSPDQLESLTHPPEWIRSHYGMSVLNDGGWEVAGGESHAVNTHFDYWYRGLDIDFLQMSETSPVHDTGLSRADPNRFEVLRSASNPDGADGDDDDDSEDSEPKEEEDIPLTQRWRVASRPGSPFSALESPDDNTEVPEIPPVPCLSPRDAFLVSFGVLHAQVPTGNRRIEELEAVLDIWTMSKKERGILGAAWIQEARLRDYEIQRAEFERVKRLHKDAQERFNDLRDESRVEILRRACIVACTTNGAAKLTSVLKAFGPQIIVAEEAGQILEAHILASLVPSIQHLILIGDPQQLRPTISNYGLSMDHPRGKKIYRLDQSLMERLANVGLKMSQLTVQRRMRPVISSLIRTTLYPRLEDHSVVLCYPAVRGIAHNVFFVSHSGMESGGDEESISKHNKFEASMIKDLVIHLLRQGVYNQDGDIVVLCAYLGQLAEIRRQLANEVITVVDDRDMVKLAEAEEAGQDTANHTSLSTSVEHVKVSHRVLLRTVDNFQGEEAKIVILSLVRNSGSLDQDGNTVNRAARQVNATIGFLKSNNRTNVALSRAKEGMYIFGEAPLLASRSQMWRSVIDELDSIGCIGAGVPISCQRHPDEMNLARKPGEIRQYAPDGGCLRACESRLQCGHMCTYKCHSDDPGHAAVRCIRDCARLCPLGHPCNKECAQECGSCNFPARDVTIPSCGHVILETTCHFSRHPEQIQCPALVKQKLPNCEHTATVRCGSDLSLISCKESCNQVAECGHSCSARCHECQSLNKGDKVDRVRHIPHPCKRDLLCGHPCLEDCTPGHECSGTCRARCRQSCTHQPCYKGCSKSCSPCLQPCTWVCDHEKCLLPCGSICSRLPCDEKCSQTLACGHQCPSVCGEPCSRQVCPQCATDGDLDQLVDLILQRTLGEVRDAGEDDAQLVTLQCGHVFTVETLDGHTQLEEHYRRDPETGRWLGLKEYQPQAGLTSIPRCPNCRADVDSPRYNRVAKRAKLDLMENNVASHLSRSLETVRRIVSSFDPTAAKEKFTEMAARAAAAPLPRGAKTEIHKKKKKAAFNTERLRPVSLGELEIAARVRELSSEWRKTAEPLLKAYKEATAIAAKPSAHRLAYEAAFAQLYRSELQEAKASGRPAPEQYAMRLAKIAMGQPKPLADLRYLVEAYWVSLDIRFILSDLAVSWLLGLPENNKHSETHGKLWSNFACCLYESMVHDANDAAYIAQETSSHRQTLQCFIYTERCKFSQFQFDYQMSHRRALDAEVLEEFKLEVNRCSRDFEHDARDARAAYLKKLPENAEWLSTNWDPSIAELTEAWESIRIAINGGVFYREVSFQEKASIVNALGFGHRGHWYQCPNGHPYVIGECGGAMETSVCPECGEQIGGGNHRLTQDNTRATDLEDMNPDAAVDPYRWVERNGRNPWDL